MDELKINARAREERGSAASRRLRRAGEVPGILATAGQEPVPLAVTTQEFEKVLRSGAQLVKMRLGEEELEVLVREIQWDAMGDNMLHVDFDRVVRGEKLTLEIPLEFFGEAAGVAEGGVFQTHLNTINVECLPRAIPDMVEIDVTALEIGGEIRARDITLPEGVELYEIEPDTLIVNVTAQVVEEEEAEEGEEVEAGTEPEVISEKKEESD
jgi:large subunit ribosomal protein L25